MFWLLQEEGRRKKKEVIMDVGVRASTGNGSSWKWNTPVPYLYVGLAAMLGLISLALLYLACSLGKPEDDERSQQDVDVEKPSKLILPPPEYEPKFVVIMAGEDMPTYLAKPIPFFRNTPQLQVGDLSVITME